VAFGNFGLLLGYFNDRSACLPRHSGARHEPNGSYQFGAAADAVQEVEHESQCTETRRPVKREFGVAWPTGARAGLFALPNRFQAESRLRRPVNKAIAVIPAKAGIQWFSKKFLDSGFRRNDGKEIVSLFGVSK
jgi:hypothetical protein